MHADEVIERDLNHLKVEFLGSRIHYPNSKRPNATLSFEKLRQGSTLDED